MNWTLAQLVPLIFFLVACTDDLLTRKFHNSLFILFLVIGALAHVFLLPNGSFISGSLGVLAAVAATFPLVALGAVGAGDLKLMITVGLVTDANTAFWTVVYSLVWASIMGLIKVVLSKQWKLLFVKAGKAESGNFKQIPFTISLMMGWLQLQLWGVL